MKFKVVILAASMISGLAFGQSSLSSAVWVARLTEQKQCNAEFAPSLGKAVSEIESEAQVQVKIALVDHLKGRVMCMSCGCPAGSYYIAQVTKASSEIIDTLKSQDWEIVDPSEIPGLPQAQQEGSYRPLPVGPVLQ